MSDHDLQITAIGPKRHRAAVKQLVNDERGKHGLGPLRFNSLLVISARAWAIHERDSGDVGHGDFKRRALRFPFVLAGTPSSRFVGENVAFATGDLSTPRAIVGSWMGSSGHRANILRKWSYGAVWSSPVDVDGVVVVQHFGRTAK